MDIKKRGNPAMVKGGPSINPHGRPRTGMAFAEELRRRVDPGEVIDRVLSVLRGEPLVRCIDTSTGKIVVKRAGDDLPENLAIQETIWPGHEHILSAATYLRDSGYFKPAQLVADVSAQMDAEAPDYSRLSAEQLEQLIELQEIASGRLAPGDQKYLDIKVDGEQKP